MEKIIKKAIEGGYQNHSINQAYLLFDGLDKAEVFVNGYGWCFLHKKGEEAEGGVFTIKSDSFRKEEILLDPLFWQALEKACGWTKDEEAIKELRNEINIENLDYQNSLENPTETEQFSDGLKKQREHIGKLYLKLDDMLNTLHWKDHALKFHEINLTKGMDKAIEYLSTLIEQK